MSLDNLNHANADGATPDDRVFFYTSPAAQTIYTLSAVGVRQAFSLDPQGKPPPREGARYLPGIGVSGTIDAALCGGRPCPRYSAAEVRALAAIAYLGAGSMTEEYKKEAIAQLCFGRAYRRGLSVPADFLDTLTATDIQRCASEYTQLALFALAQGEPPVEYPLVRQLLAEGRARAGFMLREPFSIEVTQQNTCCPAFMRLEAKEPLAGKAVLESAPITLSSTQSGIDRFTLSWTPSRAAVRVTAENGAALSAGALPRDTPLRLAADADDLAFTFGTPYLYAMTDLFLPADDATLAPLLINTYERFTKSLTGRGA